MTTKQRPSHRWCRVLVHAAMLVALPLPAMALDWYTVEVLVFAERSDAGLDEEAWSTSPGAPDLAGALEPGSAGEFEWLSESTLELSAVARQLDRSGRYRTLLLSGWRQPGYGPRRALPVHLRSDPAVSLLNPAAGTFGGVFATPLADRAAVEGLVRVHRSRYLHVLVDLLYSRPAQAFHTAADGSQVAPTPTLFRLSQTRRMRSREMHYYDHPLFGVLVKITPHGTQTEAEPTEDPAAAAEDDSEAPVSSD